MVQTTRDHSSVNKNTYLVAQRIAEDFPGFNGLTFLIWPFEYVVKLQIYLVRHLPTIITFRPRTWHIP